MVIRCIKENHWEHIYGQITKYGKTAPLSLQYDIEINYNGMEYVLKVQPESDRKIVALQLHGIYPDGEEMGAKDYGLIQDNKMLSSLLEIIIYQGANKRK